MTNRKELGFTLIELIIVVFVMAIVAGALIANFRSGENQKRVNLSRDTIITALRTAQNYSLSGKQIPPASQAPFVRGSARCSPTNNAAVAYWVEFQDTASTFSIMAQDTCGAVMSVQTYALVGRTRLAATNPLVLNTGSGGVSQTRLAVMFEPPFGSMSATSTQNPVNSDFSSFVSATFSLTDIDGNRSETVTVDGISGKIE